ncbi:MAG TPA: energy-dependent translational throttle protein EttA, partial [Spirochaetota bacterium]|nr:energy-dependent translational throttle protein EttA [Spirochaetota bacterium]
PQLDPDKNVIDNIKGAMSGTLALLKRFEKLSEQMGEDLPEDEMNKVMAEFGEIQEKLDKINGWDIERTLNIAMDALRVPPAEAAVSDISGGERRRVALCRLLLENPDVLILDEPTNHLDAESIQWLEIYLSRYKGTVIAVTHDRYFLDNVAGWILELDRGEGIPFKGNYSAWLEAKQQRLANEAQAEKKRQQTLAHELEWIKQGAKGRQSKSKARIAAYENLLSRENKEKVAACEIALPVPPRLGEQVIELKNITKSYGESVLLENLSLLIPRGAIVGIIGPNGAGKTTLCNIIAGLEKPDSGEVIIGKTVKMAYINQLRTELNGENTVWQEISQELDEIQVGNKTIASRAYVGSFGFKGSEQQTYVKQLSGGERNRVHLAKLLRSGGNVILLDEPTNDLDVSTLRALEDALINFAGCVLTVSHDRYFLDRICTHILAFEDEARVEFYNGNFSAYEKYKMGQLGEKEIKPQRIKYKKLIR